jgi:hypothetical protein
MRSKLWKDLALSKEVGLPLGEFCAVIPLIQAVTIPFLAAIEKVKLKGNRERGTKKR